VDPEEVKSLLEAGPLTLALVCLAFVCWAAARIAVAKWAHAPRLSLDEARGEVLTEAFTKRFENHAKMLHDFSGPVGRAEAIAGRVKALEVQFEEHMRDSSTHTRQLTDLRIKVAEVSVQVSATKEAMESMGDRMGRIEDGVGEIRKALMDGKAKS
jgi:hypothetical protein